MFHHFLHSFVSCVGAHVSALAGSSVSLEHPVVAGDVAALVANVAFRWFAPLAEQARLAAGIRDTGVVVAEADCISLWFLLLFDQ